ncbi:MAG: PocR ligand-binding domain-containing protein, partial [bacterium]
MSDINGFYDSKLKPIINELEKERKKIKEIVDLYSYSTNIGCKAVNVKNMEILASDSGHPSFCNLVCSFDKGKNDCKNSYLYGALQVEKLGEEYIYFCPYGLVNWTVPIFNDKELTNILVGGPVLLHTVDDLLIEDILKQNPSLVNIYR